MARESQSAASHDLRGQCPLSLVVGEAIQTAPDRQLHRVAASDAI